MTADSLTVAPSSAELWVAYHRKAIISAGPVLLAGLNIVRDAAQTPDGVNWSTIVLAVFAAAQAVGTYLPDNARAKLVASGILAVAGGVTAAVTDGISTYSLLLVVTQAVAWASAGAVENGAAPAVVKADLEWQDGDPVLGATPPTTFDPDDRGDVGVLEILMVVALICVVLLLFGVSFR